jgi:hypothetical protein
VLAALERQQDAHDAVVLELEHGALDVVRQPAHQARQVAERERRDHQVELLAFTRQVSFARVELGHRRVEADAPLERRREPVRDRLEAAAAR